MRVLLDTHALLWWASGDTKLPRRIRAVIADESNEVTVSAASAWEIATKHRVGRLVAPEALLEGLLDYLEDQHFTDLPVSVRHAQRAGTLASNHRDPFDRVLVAQAQIEGFAIVSVDRVFDDFGVRRVW
jgi:PIN domain nuclease of toxin-antitoxin system